MPYRSALPVAFAIVGAITPPATATPPAPAVAVRSSVFVENTEPAAGGQARELTSPALLARGDRIITLVSWSAPHPAPVTGFTVTDSIPAALAYQPPHDANAEISVDGGHRWGRLGTLRVGGRLATAADVTNLRWRVTPAAARRGSGQIAYAGVVR